MGGFNDRCHHFDGCYHLSFRWLARMHHHAESECHGSTEADLEAVGLTAVLDSHYRTFWHVYGPGLKVTGRPGDDALVRKALGALGPAPSPAPRALV